MRSTRKDPMPRRRCLLPAVLAAGLLAGMGLPTAPAVAKDGGAKVEAKAAKHTYASATGRKNR